MTQAQARAFVAAIAPQIVAQVKARTEETDR
jgi:hypothetical protein